MSEPKLESELELFDVTNLVVGAIIGADIYVASSFGASQLGPFSLFVWVVAGIIAMVIALCFAQCAALLPRTGGPYAYAREVWGPFTGFMVGWSLWIAEWIALSVFPVAFTRYLMFFLPNLDWIQQIMVKGLFVTFLAATNIVGVKVAGKTNNVLTLTKLTPLIFFSGSGLLYLLMNTSKVASNFSPLTPYGFENFGVALILIFWAYAGFEISTIPADEIKDPSNTIPKAIMIGVSMITVFYLITNVVLFGVRPWYLLASDTAPLASATTEMLSSNLMFTIIGQVIVGGGALISVAGSNESGMIGTSRLSYALAVDGLFPRVFARVHKKFKTPYLAILIQAGTAFIASIVGNLSLLISVSVLFFAITYLATSLSTFSLRKRCPKPKFSLKGGLLIPSLSVIFSLYLISQCAMTQFLIGLVLLSIGVPIYAKYSPKSEIEEFKRAMLSRSSILMRVYRQENRFLALVLRYIKRAYRKIVGEEQKWRDEGVLVEI